MALAPSSLGSVAHYSVCCSCCCFEGWPFDIHRKNQAPLKFTWKGPIFMTSGVSIKDALPTGSTRGAVRFRRINDTLLCVLFALFNFQ